MSVHQDMMGDWGHAFSNVSLHRQLWGSGRWRGAGLAMLLETHRVCWQCFADIVQSER